MEKGFVRAGKLEAGDEILTSEGQKISIVKIEIEVLAEPVYVYNFTVEDFHTYFASELGVWVHNACLKKKGGSDVPNPYGKKGGPAHQQVIEEIKQDAKGRGLSYETEYRFDTSGGFKNSRYADVVVFDSKGRVMEIHQVGRTTKKYGAPVARERKAIRDIRSSNDYNGAKIMYHPYDRIVSSEL